jgi:hypothetical protein
VTEWMHGGQRHIVVFDGTREPDHEVNHGPGPAPKVETAAPAPDPVIGHTTTSAGEDGSW